MEKINSKQFRKFLHLYLKMSGESDLHIVREFFESESNRYHPCGIYNETIEFAKRMLTLYSQVTINDMLK